MFDRQLPNFSKVAYKQILRDYFNAQTGKTHNSITNIKQYFQFDTSGETYEYLLEQYNNEVEDKQKLKRSLKAKDTRIKNINLEYNNLIANAELQNTTMSNQISTKFSLGEASFQLKDANFYDNIRGKMTKKHSKTVLTDAPTPNLLNRILTRIYDLLMTNAGQYNRIYITNRESGNVVSSSLMDDMTFDDFYNILSNIVQSAGLAVLGQLTFTLQYRNMPYGGNSIEIPEFLKKQGITLIINDDNCCGQRCLVYADAKNSDDFKYLKKTTNQNSFNTKVLKMCNELNIHGKMTYLDFQIYADLRKVQVIIVAGLFVEMFSTATEYEQQVYIYHDTAAQHYHYINDINAASNDSKRNNKWCKYCRKSIRRSNFEKHKCVETKCGCCNVNFCSVIEKDNHFNSARKNKSWAKCELCNLWCAGDDCLEVHLKKCKGDSIRCLECKKWVEKTHFDSHICGEKFCSNCDTYYEGEHRCYIKPLVSYILDASGNRVYSEWQQDIYTYDFESMFDENNNHIVNLCLVKKLFDVTNTVHKFDTIEEFVKFCVSKKNSTFIAHNGKAYDNWMVHKYLINHTGHRPNKLILAGNKIMYMKVKSVRFIDSLNHIAQGLATFPKTFGLTEMKKGFFPYLFNVKENQNYIGKIPSKEYFNTFAMSSAKLNEFNNWYDNQNGVYDFKKELYEYCLSDVDILAKSLEIYVNNAIQETGINPLSCSTVASYCLKVYRTNYMNDNQIAVLTKDEYDFCKRGFFGGRTEVFKLFKSWTDEEIASGVHGKYIDIQSLYPSVQFFDDLPCGIPVYDENPTVENYSEYIDTHYGYIECDITCPPNLHIPLLPEKKNNKLMFDLVDKVKAVYSSVELKRALEIGYKITHIYKALTFDKSDNMFKGYIQNFLKIKTESAGYDGADIDAYIQRYFDNCGVLLDKNKIKKNSGMKLLAKICLNSLWGKFGQNDELPTTAYIKNDAWFKLLKRHINKEVELKNEIMIDEETLYVSYIEKVEARTSLLTTNLALAGFTTANARLRLYKELYKLNQRVIYCDTDSIIYEYRKDEYNTVEGDCLGEWELEDNGNLKNVYCLAPKTYGYTSLDGEQKYKCKGITLNSGNKNSFNFETLKNLIVGDHKAITTYSDDFIKDNKTGNIRTKKNVAKFTNYNHEGFKRRFADDGTSTPFTN
jgi:hypothetical protein